MLSARGLALRRGQRLLLEHANFTLLRGWKVGVVGANGSGKSSLFALLRGEMEPDAGELALPPGLTIAHVAQETPALPEPALEFVLDGDHELRRVQRQLAELATAPADGLAVARLHADLERLDGYTAPGRAAALLHGLGFAASDVGRPVAEFSGGWRMRLNLAQALMCPADLLLLDEPTNHLDLEAILWLEDWLRNARSTILVIAHDREFLDRVVDHVLCLVDGQTLLSTGNYSEFEIRRAEQIAAERSAYQRQQREVARVQSFVQRFGAKATKARQAQSRLKALERLALIAPAHVGSPFRFSFPAAGRMPDPLLGLRDVCIDHGPRRILSGTVLSLVPGDRIGLVGPNGAGKSSLMRVLAGAAEPAAGTRTTAENLRIGYFAQHQLEQLAPGRSALEHLKGIDRDASEQTLRDFLGGFGFTGDEVFRASDDCSGGERARLVLALLVYAGPQLLLLDEPTNHLDLEMRLALELALQEFEGALVLVSHDRHLMRSVTDRLVLVADGRADPFAGDLEDYRSWLAERRRVATAEAPTVDARRERKRDEAERRQRLAPLRARLRTAEAELERLGAERSALEAQLASADLYLDEARARLKSVLSARSANAAALAAAETTWLAAAEALEAGEAER